MVCSFYAVFRYKYEKRHTSICTYILYSYNNYEQNNQISKAWNRFKSLFYALKMQNLNFDNFKFAQTLIT